MGDGGWGIPQLPSHPLYMLPSALPGYAGFAEDDLQNVYVCCNNYFVSMTVVYVMANSSFQWHGNSVIPVPVITKIYGTYAWSLSLVDMSHDGADCQFMLCPLPCQVYLLVALRQVHSWDVSNSINSIILQLCHMSWNLSSIVLALRRNATKWIYILLPYAP